MIYQGRKCHQARKIQHQDRSHQVINCSNNEENYATSIMHKMQLMPYQGSWKTIAGFHMMSLKLKLQSYWSSWDLISWCIRAT